MQPEEAYRQRAEYVQDLDLLKDTTEDIIAELNRLKEVHEDDSDLVEESVINTDLHIPDAIVHLGARPRTAQSLQLKSAA